MKGPVMNLAKKALTRTQKFVSDHKVGIAVATTTVVCFVAHRTCVKEWNQFLEAEGLMDKFYNAD